jgi:hypothetical protein
VITGVLSLRTTVTNLGTWLSVRHCSKAIAAWAICCATVDPALFTGLALLVATVPRHTERKKAGVVERPEVSDHAGLLVNEPPGFTGLLFS